MTDRIVIPTEDQNGLNACLAEHFGRAPYYTVVDFDEKDEVSNVKSVPNVSEHAGGTGYAHDQIMEELKPNAIIVYGMGQKGLNTFQSAKVMVLKANANMVSEVVTAYKEDKLQELTEGCEHAQHHTDDHTDHHTHHHLAKACSGGKTVSRNLSEEELKLMVESGYSKKAIELYVNNINMGTLQNPSVATPFLGPCGDLIELYLKIDKNDTIEDAKFHYLGCPGSAASASAMTILVKGKTIDQAKKMTENDILMELGGLPKSKLDCAKLSIKTLRKAIAEFELVRSRSEK